MCTSTYVVDTTDTSGDYFAVICEKISNLGTAEDQGYTVKYQLLKDEK